jgi:hypothetical protein
MSPAGRPEIGQPINIRLGDELLDAVDNYAADHEVSRAEAIRILLADALAPLLVRPEDIADHPPFRIEQPRRMT